MKKVSFNLTEHDLEHLRQVAERRDTTMTGALRYSIALAKFIEDSISTGARVVIEDQEGIMKQLFIRI